MITKRRFVARQSDVCDRARRDGGFGGEFPWGASKKRVPKCEKGAVIRFF